MSWLLLVKCCTAANGSSRRWQLIITKVSAAVKIGRDTSSRGGGVIEYRLSCGLGQGGCIVTIRWGRYLSRLSWAGLASCCGWGCGSSHWACSQGLRSYTSHQVGKAVAIGLTSSTAGSLKGRSHPTVPLTKHCLFPACQCSTESSCLPGYKLPAEKVCCDTIPTKPIAAAIHLL